MEEEGLPTRIFVSVGRVAAPTDCESASHPGFLLGGWGFWQKNAWEWASFNKGSSLALGRGTALGFTPPSIAPFCLSEPGGLSLLLLLRFMGNGFTCRLREKYTEEGRNPGLKL